MSNLPHKVPFFQIQKTLKSKYFKYLESVDWVETQPNIKVV